MPGINREEVERRLDAGDSLRSIASDLGVTYQTLQYHRRQWGGAPLRAARTSGDSHASWRGGSFVDGRGYRMILRPDNPRANKYVPEHILVAEGARGRGLARNEVVHHINGDKLDNREENLIILTRQEHARLHAELERLAFAFLDRGAIIFADGAYRLAESG